MGVQASAPVVGKAITGDRDAWPLVTRLAARYEAGLYLAVRHALRAGALAVHPDLVRAAGTDVDALVAALPLASAGRLLAEAVRPRLVAAYLDGMEAGAAPLERLGILVHRSGAAVEKRPLGVSFDAVNPEAVAWAREHAGALVVGSASVREIVNTLVSASQALGLTVGELRRRIQQLMVAGVMGLDDRRAKAIFRFEQELRESGIVGEALAKRVARYADAQRRARALLIARTESIAALNNGQLALWRHAAGSGLLSRAQMGKQWIVTDDDILCPLCERLTDETVGLDEAFPGGVLCPPLHPACRCAIGLRPIAKVA